MANHVFEELRTAAITREFSGADLGDLRRDARLEVVVRAIANDPKSSFARLNATEADREAFYKFIRNQHIDSSDMLAPHVERTVERAGKARRVLVLHDTSEIRVEDDAEIDSFLQPSRRGFLMHTSLVVDANRERSPLGVVNLETIERKKLSKCKTADGRRLRGSETAKLKDKEYERWSRGIEASAQRLSDLDEVVHVLDAEGDSYSLFASMTSAEHDFVVRLCHDRVAKAGDSEWSRVREVVEGGKEFKRTREIHVSRRKGRRRPNSRPARDSRVAHLTFAFEHITVKRPTYLKSIVDQPEIELTAVRVYEKSPPDGVEPIEWILLTSLDVSSKADAERVVDIYRQRWLIEEFFKALKTGCGFRKRKLKNRHSIYNSLHLLLPFAWRALALRQAATDDKSRASTVFDDAELSILVAKAKSLRVRFNRHSSAADALLLVAQIAGHRKSNGPPGWGLIIDGLRELETLAVGWRLAKEEITG
jgi:IS4 transposase